jgi:outer membrane protein assembly factor BamB
VQWAALVGDGLIVAAGRGQSLILLSVHAGPEREIRLLQRVATSPAVSTDGTIWALGEHGTLWGIAPSGRVRASSDLGAVAESLALGSDGGVRVGLPGGEIVCVGPSGDERWRRGVDGRPGQGLLDNENTLLFVTARGTLYAVAHDGELLFRRALGVRGAGRPVLGSDGTVYVVSHSGQIEAWR